MQNQMDNCKVDGCDRKVRSRGLCENHYRRWRKYGDPFGGGPPRATRGSLVSWLQEHVDHPDTIECLRWPFTRDHRHGRGMISFRGTMTTASRAMCILSHGEPPTPDHHAAHSCRGATNGCCNPWHLRWATAAENEADKITDCTKIVGERHWRCKITSKQVGEIRLLKGVLSARRIGEKYGISMKYAQDIIDGRYRKHG
jgi:hypothetical protein